MGSDLKMVKGRKQYVDDVKVATMTAMVRERYPTAWAEGSMGTYHWRVEIRGEEPVVVAEAWFHRNKHGWWLRIKE